jgi:hypothetical protein
MIGFCIGVCLVVLLLVVSPFFIGSGGLLAQASSESSVARLESMKKAILKRYLQDEEAAEKGEIGKLSWTSRKRFLMNRYLDASRRLDYLRHMASESPQEAK